MAAAAAVVDIGSGAGFPGLALAIAMPEARFDLVESIAPQGRVHRAGDRVVWADATFA